MNIDKTCKSIAKQLNLPYETVKQIIMHQFIYTIGVMKNPDDYRDILFNKSFKFKLKNRFKEDKTKNYSPNEQDNSN